MRDSRAAEPKAARQQTQRSVEITIEPLTLDSRGRLAALKDGALPLNIEVTSSPS